MKIVYSPTYLRQRKDMDGSDVMKLEQACEVHGYRGLSKKKHNGIVNIRPDDKQLWKSIAKYKSIDSYFIKENTTNLIFQIDIKVVAHCPSGNRVVGSLYRGKDDDNFVVILLGFANYNHSI